MAGMVGMVVWAGCTIHMLGSKKRVRLVSLIRLLSEHHLLFSIALSTLTHCVEYDDHTIPSHVIILQVLRTQFEFFNS